MRDALSGLPADVVSERSYILQLAWRLGELNESIQPEIKLLLQDAVQSRTTQHGEGLLVRLEALVLIAQMESDPVERGLAMDRFMIENPDEESQKAVHEYFPDLDRR